MSHDIRYKTRRWKKRRSEFLKKHPLCRKCQELEHRVVLAVIADHLIPVRDANDPAFWSGELQGLCRRHHNVKTHGEQHVSW